MGNNEDMRELIQSARRSALRCRDMGKILVFSTIDLQRFFDPPIIVTVPGYYILVHENQRDIAEKLCPGSTKREPYSLPNIDGRRYFLKLPDTPDTEAFYRAQFEEATTPGAGDNR